MDVVLSGCQKWRIKVLMVLGVAGGLQQQHPPLFKSAACCVDSPFLHKLYDKGDLSSFLHITG
jgi:hypothetical protein